MFVRYADDQSLHLYTSKKLLANIWIPNFYPAPHSPQGENSWRVIHSACRFLDSCTRYAAGAGFFLADGFNDVVDGDAGLRFTGRRSRSVLTGLRLSRVTKKTPFARESGTIGITDEAHIESHDRAFGSTSTLVVSLIFILSDEPQLAKHESCATG